VEFNEGMYGGPALAQREKKKRRIGKMMRKTVVPLDPSRFKEWEIRDQRSVAKVITGGLVTLRT
jgi:hypothetical protein